MLDDHEFLDRQRDYDVLIEECDVVNLICKTRTNLPGSVDPIFDIKFGETLHGAYLKEHLTTAHMPVSGMARTIDMA
jgi:hypothetical protein